ncbi:MAG TPA: hypothetical protein PKG60_13940 [Spirochaetota bacterium]|nr:hypothetical protein [Spirochaetota bacterium]HPS88098.1 hypothetical protein [Spirochaetota bacterium]
MKKTMLTLISLAMILQLVQCSSSTASSTKATPVKSDPVVESCKKDCTAAYGKCVQAAGKNESKKAACSTNIANCYSKCDTKAKGYKKPAPMKYQKSPEI